MNDFVTKARLFYANLEPARQSQLWLALAGVLIAVVATSWWMSTEPYATLQSGTQEEMAEVAARLNDSNIPSRYEPPNLLVPQAQLGEALGVVGQGKTQKGVPEAGMLPSGLAPSAFKWTQLRQKEGDLARSIAELPGIQGANVDITPGETSLFRDDPDTPARASVFLRVSGNQPPNAETATAIAHMVGNAVEGLDPSYVTVTDSMGTTHRDGQGGGNDDTRASHELMQIQRKYASEARFQVVEQLRKVVGMNDAFVVSATAEIEREARVERIKDYNTDKIWKNESMLDEQAREKSSPPAEGAPGVDSNQPERNAEANAPAGGGMNKEDKTRIQDRFTAPESLEQITIPAGELKRLAVAVTLNETALAEHWGLEPATPEWDAKIAQLEGVSQTAFGFDAERGDAFTMTALPFAPIPVEEAPAVNVSGILGMVAPFVPYAIALVALLLAFMFVVRPLMAQVAKAPLPRITSEDELGPDGKPRRIAAGDASDEDNLAERLHRLVENFQPVDSHDLNKLVEQQSDASAKVVRDWMKQEA